MGDFQVLLDAPGEPAKRIQIARLGPVKDPRYGEFEITADNAANWQRNLSALPGRRALIDFEHRSERKPRDSEAAGWLTSISLDGDKVMGDVDWTPKGESAIRDKRYLFLSPAYGMYANERGETFDDTLMSVALTNKPALGDLPMLTLASEERLQQAVDGDDVLRVLAQIDPESLRMLEVLTSKQRDNLDDSDFAIPSQRAYPIHDLAHARNALARVAQFGSSSEQDQVKAAVYRRYPQLKPSGKALDSRAPMSTEATSPELLKLLDLPEDADDATILDAVTKLKTPAVEPDVKTLEQQAKDAGMIMLDATAVAQLQTQAAAGAQAQRELHEQKFEHAFTRALDDRKVTPAEKDSLHHFYELDADATIKLLDSREPIVPAAPVGQPVLELDLDTPTRPEQALAAGVHPDAHETHRKVLAKLKELDRGPDLYTQTLLEMSQKGQL